MRRASLTVIDKKGEQWDANHLAITTAPAEGGSVSMLTFECSGEVKSIPAADVAAVEFHQAGATWCTACDQSLWSHVGAGIHANPTAEEQTKEQAG